METGGVWKQAANMAEFRNSCRWGRGDHPSPLASPVEVEETDRSRERQEKGLAFFPSFLSCGHPSL